MNFSIKRWLVSILCAVSTLSLAQQQTSSDGIALQQAYGVSAAALQATTGTYRVAAPPGSSNQDSGNSPEQAAGQSATQSQVQIGNNPGAMSAAHPGADRKPQLREDSDVFGANLFTGAFAKHGATRFNPDYSIMVGDRIQLRIWGGFQSEGVAEVDPQGNIFLPHVGPVQVLGVRNEELQRVVEKASQRVFRANVYVYASLAAAQPVRVFVGGGVMRPGLYSGTSMDSLLSYLDQAGGIDPERGSFLQIEVKRGDTVRANVNLYDFLINGRIPLVQLAEGDVIFVSQRQSTVKVGGLVSNAKRFEFSGESKTVFELMSLVKPNPQATHVRVTRNTGNTASTEYYPLETAGNIIVRNGDDLEFTADKKPGTISVRVEGEHLSAQEYVLPYGARLGELMSRIEFSERSDSTRPQLFRQSIRLRQKQLLAVSLKTLESSVLTARSGTASEAMLRAEEAKIILQWVERAKQIEPLGQVVIAHAGQRDNLLLENGDVIKIHAKDGLVLIGGEVLFPNTLAFVSGYDADDYIKAAGGYTQNADNSRVVVAHRDGSFERGNDANIVAGDEILVLPKVDVKSREIAKDIMQIVYQLAIAAKVALGL